MDARSVMRHPRGRAAATERPAEHFADAAEPRRGSWYRAHSVDSSCPRRDRLDRDEGARKDRSRRYETASGFAADVQRYLAGDPIAAAPPSVGYRIRKFTRRHRTGVLTAVGFAIVLVLAALMSTVQAIIAMRARAEAITQRSIAIAARDAEAEVRVQAVAERDRSARNAYINAVNLAWQEWFQGNPARTRALLAAARPAKRGEIDFRGFEWFYLDRLTRTALWTYAPSEFLVPSIAVGPDRTWIAVARDPHEPGQGDIQILDAQTSLEIGLIPAGRHVGSGIALVSDGSRVASCAEDQSVVVWDRRSGAEVSRFRGHKVNPLRVAFSPDGKLLASLGAESRPGGSKSEVKVWDLANNRTAKTSIEIHSYVSNTAFSPDGRFLATAGPGIHVWNVATGKLVWQTPETEVMTDVAYAPDGKSLAGASFEGWIGFWGASDGTRRTTLPGHRGEVHCVAFRPDGKRLATAGRDRVIRIWDLSTNATPTELRGHESDIWNLAYSADGGRLASASFLDGVVHSARRRSFDRSPQRQDGGIAPQTREVREYRPMWAI